MKKSLAILAAVLSFNAFANETLVVGATPVPHAEILEFVKPVLAKEGVDLQIKVFTDFIQPNQQLALKNIDANYYPSTGRFWMITTRLATPTWCR